LRIVRKGETSELTEGTDNANAINVAACLPKKARVAGLLGERTPIQR